MTNLFDIVGQDRAIAQLQRALAGGRMPHAMIFAGPLGVGRRTTAHALAQLLLCEKPVEVGRESLKPAARRENFPEGIPLRQACGHCRDCQMMKASSHPDFHPVYKELARYHDNAQVRDRVMQELGIDVIESFLIRPALRSPQRGRGKVFVVREADLMSPSAQNALLKTLEEPPKGVTIILLCQQPEEMLPTTLSRCSLLPFGLLPVDFVRAKLAQEALPAAEAEFWARFTGGSIGRSLSLSRMGLYAIKRETLDRLAAMGPSGEAELGEALAKTTEALAEQAVKEAKQADGSELSKSLAGRRAAGAMIEIIASAYADAMHLRCAAMVQADQAPTPGATAIVNQDQPSQVQALADRFEPAQLARIIEQLSQYEQILWRNVSAKIVWDNVVITCATASSLRL